MRFIAILLTCAAAQAADGKDALSRFLGTWKGTGDFQETEYSHKGTTRGTTICQWSAMRAFLVCDQEHSGPEGSARDLSVYAYDDGKHEYRFFNLGQDGHHATTKLTVTADQVIYETDNPDKTKKLLFRTTNKWETPDRYTYRAEFTTDGGANWTTMISGVSTREKN